MIVNAEGLHDLARAELAFGYLTRRLSRRTVTVRFGGRRRAYVGRRSFDSDFEALRGVFLPRRNIYRTEYRDVALLDIGAHKGYVSAYALLHGARLVVSYEPESVNFALLKRAARSFRERGDDWRVRQAAVGAQSGRAVLHVSGDSQSHSLVSPPMKTPSSDEGAAREVDRTEVNVVGIAEALADVADHERVVVKIDAEGSECEIVDALTDDLAAGIQVVFLEEHEFASCGADRLATALAEFGFARHATADPTVIRFQK